MNNEIMYIIVRTISKCDCHINFENFKLIIEIHNSRIETLRKLTIGKNDSQTKIDIHSTTAYK